MRVNLHFTLGILPKTRCDFFAKCNFQLFDNCDDILSGHGGQQLRLSFAKLGHSKKRRDVNQSSLLSSRAAMSRIRAVIDCRQPTV